MSKRVQLQGLMSRHLSTQAAFCDVPVWILSAMQHADNFDLFGPYSIKHNVTFNREASHPRQKLKVFNAHERLFSQGPKPFFEIFEVF